MREFCSHEVSFHSIPIAFCEGCTFIVRIDYLWFLRWWPQCLQYADFQTSWPVIGEKPEQPHPTVPLQWAPWTATWVWRSVVVELCELLAVVNELRPTTVTTAIPAKNFFVFIIACAKFVSHPTFMYFDYQWFLWKWNPVWISSASLHCDRNVCSSNYPSCYRSSHGSRSGCHWTCSRDMAYARDRQSLIRLHLRPYQH